MATEPLTLPVNPLTKAAFAPFGEVIETEGSRHFSINNGSTERFHDLARIDVDGDDGGRPLISIFRAQAWRLPIVIAMLERHPLGSQAFVPLHGQRFLIVAAPAGDVVDERAVRAFISNGRQGVNYARGVWHHPLLALDEGGDYLIVDRGGAGSNCDEAPLARRRVIEKYPK